MTDTITRMVSLVDLTLLKEGCEEQAVRHLCEKAFTPFGHVACVCVFPEFTALAAQLLKNTPVAVATVCNFPSGNERLESTLAEIDAALLQGAEEIDLVMPYSAYLSGERGKVIQYIESCRKACPVPVLLKVILETGAFPAQAQVYTAAKDMIYAGADFIKTSTGKITVGADLESVHSILNAIKATFSSQQEVGVKISGGIRTAAQAEPYLELAETIMRAAWISPHTFRIGTSQLLESLHASS